MYGRVEKDPPQSEHPIHKDVSRGIKGNFWGVDRVGRIIDYRGFEGLVRMRLLISFCYVPDPFCAVFRNFLGCSRNFLGCSWGVGIFFRVKMRCSGNIKIVEHTLIFNTLAVKLTNRTYCVGSFMVRVFNRVTTRGLGAYFKRCEIFRRTFLN